MTRETVTQSTLLRDTFRHVDSVNSALRYMLRFSRYYRSNTLAISSLPLSRIHTEERFRARARLRVSLFTYALKRSFYSCDSATHCWRAERQLTMNNVVTQIDTAFMRVGKLRMCPCLKSLLYIGCVSIFTISTKNLQCTLRILYISSTDSEYRNAAHRYTWRERRCLLTCMNSVVWIASSVVRLKVRDHLTAKGGRLKWKSMFVRHVGCVRADAISTENL